MHSTAGMLSGVALARARLPRAQTTMPKGVLAQGLKAKWEDSPSQVLEGVSQTPNLRLGSDFRASESSEMLPASGSPGKQTSITSRAVGRKEAVTLD